MKYFSVLFVLVAVLAVVCWGAVAEPAEESGLVAAPEEKKTEKRGIYGFGYGHGLYGGYYGGHGFGHGGFGHGGYGHYPSYYGGYHGGYHHAPLYHGGYYPGLYHGFH